MAAGCSFVALSRLRKLSDCLINPMPFERLAKIGKLKGIQKRIEEACESCPKLNNVRPTIHVGNLNLFMHNYYY